MCVVTNVEAVSTGSLLAGRPIDDCGVAMTRTSTGEEDDSHNRDIRIERKVGSSEVFTVLAPYRGGQITRDESISQVH